MNTINTVKLPILDGIEIKSATFVDKHFPLHFHQNWILVYIEKGSENISFINNEFQLNTNSLVLIPPRSLHKNWGNSGNAWKYKAIYLSSDTIKNIASKRNLDYSLLCSQLYFVSYCKVAFEINETSIFETLENLLTNFNSKTECVNARRADKTFSELLNYLHLNYNSIITLANLEKRFKINKFKLLKNFKRNIGLSPLEYQTALRIENSKKLFYEDISLTEIALASGYYDQSHFTHSFKKYVGVTPGAYKQNSNILQDY